MPIAATRTLTLVTRVIQVSYADVAPRRKGSDGFIVRDLTGRMSAKHSK